MLNDNATIPLMIMMLTMTMTKMMHGNSHPCLYGAFRTASIISISTYHVVLYKYCTVSHVVTEILNPRTWYHTRPRPQAECGTMFEGWVFLRPCVVPCSRVEYLCCHMPHVQRIFQHGADSNIVSTIITGIDNTCNTNILMIVCIMIYIVMDWIEDQTN